MKQSLKRAVYLFFTAILVIVPFGALAETWSAPFSADAIQSISAEDNASILAYLEETSMGLDPDEVDYSYSYSIEGMTVLNGQSWYLGRWSKEFDDHVELVTDFLLDTETLQMYPCTYPEAGLIEWSGDAEMEGITETENETIGDTAQLCPYLSAHGFSFAYDVAYFAPVDGYEDYLAAVTGEEGVAFWGLNVENLKAEDFDSYMQGLIGEDEALYFQLEAADGTQIKAATVEHYGVVEHCYLVSVGSDAVCLCGTAPVEIDGIWGARFDQMAESITF